MSSAGPAPGEIDLDHVAVELDLSPAVNLALQRNAVPLVARLNVRNVAGYDLSDVGVRLSLDPAFGSGWRETISLLPSDGEQVFEAPDLRLSGERLARVQERQPASIWVEVTLREQVLLRRRHAVEVLAHNEWAGVASLPEALAAFVLPNDPALTPVLRAAADKLRAETGRSSLGGYGSEEDTPEVRDRSRATVAAIMAALAERDIGYARPPASFERRGQKIRTPAQVLEGRLGTCLDLAVLAASALEQAGLHPLLVLLRGHALVGCWLSPQTFRDSAFEEPSRLRKRVDGLQLLVLDPNGLTENRPNDGGFAWAVSEADRQLRADENFVMAIDVSRARLDQVRPIAFADAAVAEGEATKRPVGDWSVRPSDEPDAEAPEPAPDPRTRLDRWKSKLLDLSLRNRLLNARPTKKTVPFQALGAPELVAALARGGDFQVEPRLERDPNDPRHERLLREMAGGDPVRALLEADLADGRFHAGLNEDELEGRLIEIFRADNSHLQDGGSRILHLAAGFLRWFESNDSNSPRLAPLLLVPLELQRSSARGRLRLVVRQDEVRFNETLRVKLLNDFGIELRDLPRLPDDLTELEEEQAQRLVSEVFAAVGRAVADRHRWEVVKDSWLAMFSFAKYLMWLDLHQRTEQLKRSRIVKHLLETPGEALEPEGSFPDADRLDEERSPAETFCPRDADSSQLAAVHAAADGRSFVLEGPPGTGKSQTITNLIAHCLALGKRVLFVSEKRAALEVVHERLKEVGLSPWCLELHSNKAQKLEVVRQLNEALRVSEEPEPGNWARVAEALGQKRRQLNGTAQALHAPRELGLTVHEAIGRVLASEGLPLLTLDKAHREAADARRLGTTKERATRLASAAEAVAPLSEHAWRASRLREWHPGLNRLVPEISESLRAAAARQREAALEAMGLSLEEERDPSSAALEAGADLARLLLDGPVAPRRLVESESDRQRVNRWTEKGEHLSDLKHRLGERWSRSLLDVDPAPLLQVFEQAELKLPVLSWLHAWPARRALKRHASGKRLPDDLQLRRDLKTLGEARSLVAELEASGGDRRELIGPTWRGAASDWRAVRQLLRWAGEYAKALSAARRAGWLADDAEQERWLACCGPDRGLDAEQARRLEAFLGAREAWLKAADAAQEQLVLDSEQAWGSADEAGLARRVERSAGQWTESAPRLRDWSLWQRAVHAARDGGLSELVDELSAGRVPVDAAAAVAEKAILSPWLEQLFRTDPFLKDFHGREQQQRIERFRELDEELTGLAQQAVRARLAAATAAAARDPACAGSKAVLQREARKKRRHRPVRELLTNCKNLLPALKPCLLMSPLSVAQYLDPELPPFDLVVFDEASQLPSWDAVGAIARGEQLVVVGDSKQLPPTNFFMRVASDEELDEDEVEDLESILDECAAAGFHSLQLDWHYRSRHESLIAFSNAKYYGNRLLTFPSPELSSEARGLGWHFVEGAVYDRARSRTNKIEAEALVREVERRLTHPEPAIRAQSLGIVTFSNAQQAVIEDLLDARRRARPEIDAYFTKGGTVLEPVFVKNLENVQGDERDVILLSVCYGPDAEDRVYMNFGPLNQAGGERRLNVAVTRARERVEVFSGLRADRINTANTRAAGVRDLKDYLHYAERGPASLEGLAHAVVGAGPESPFESQVLERLRRAGYTVDCQVGCSGYRIDLAIRPTEESGRYVLGIECDGASYHSARTARDRDRIRQRVLEGLGWRLHRIWSTDWWSQPRQEWERLQGAIETALADAELDEPRADLAELTREEPLYAGETPAADEPLHAEPDWPPAEADEEYDHLPEAETPAPESDEGHPYLPMGAGDEPDEPPEPPAPEPAAAEDTDDDELDEDPFADDPLENLEAPVPWATEEQLAEHGARAYSVTPLSADLGSQDDFHEYDSGKEIGETLDAVVVHESPIQLELAARRVASCWGFQRTRKRTVERVRNCLRWIPKDERPRLIDGFLWCHWEEPDDHDEFRVPTTDPATHRTADELPAQEIRAAARAVRVLGGAHGRDEIVVQTARLLGFARTGRVVRERIEAALENWWIPEDDIPF